MKKKCFSDFLLLFYSRFYSQIKNAYKQETLGNDGDLQKCLGNVWKHCYRRRKNDRKSLIYLFKWFKWLFFSKSRPNKEKLSITYFL